MNVYGVDLLPTVLGRVGCIRMSWRMYRIRSTTYKAGVGVAPSFSAAKSSFYLFPTIVVV
jgi:hypothetical protein